MTGLGKVVVMGGGPAGLYAAILIARNFPGTIIDVYEQNAAGVTFGFGIILSEGGYGQFREADLASAEALTAASYQTRGRVVSVNGCKVPIMGGAVGHAIPRIKLLEVLNRQAVEAGVKVHHDIRIENPDQLGADIIIGADGVNSVVRKSFDGEFGTNSRVLSARMAWYGTNQHFPQPILSFKTTEFGLFWAAAYPHQENVSTFVAECDADAWIRSGMYRMDADERRALAERIFADELGNHGLLSNKSNFSSLPFTRTKRWWYGNRVLVGDALRSPHPSIGSGTRIAMEDVIALVNSLKLYPKQPEQAFEHFQTSHVKQSNKLVLAMERSALWYEHVGEHIVRNTPVEFVFEFMTRTGRLNEQRLRAEYPEFMEENAVHWAKWSNRKRLN